VLDVCISWGGKIAKRGGLSGGGRNRTPEKVKTQGKCMTQQTGKRGTSKSIWGAFFALGTAAKVGFFPWRRQGLANQLKKRKKGRTHEHSAEKKPGGGGERGWGTPQQAGKKCGGRWGGGCEKRGAASRGGEKQMETENIPSRQWKITGGKKRGREIKASGQGQRERFSAFFPGAGGGGPDGVERRQLNQGFSQWERTPESSDWSRDTWRPERGEGGKLPKTNKRWGFRRYPWGFRKEGSY